MKKRSITVHTVSADETIKLGQRLGGALRQGDMIALLGELGSGKTYFTKGIALGLGISPDTIITSPSFSLVNEYEGRHAFFHMDGYRLESQSDFVSTGLDEYMYGDGVTVLEWADRWPEILPEWHVAVEIFIEGPQSRKITFSGRHSRALAVLDEMIK